jgi:hypothetical protein
MISTVVALKFAAVFGGLLWYTTRYSRRLKAEAAQARENEKAAAQPSSALSA